MTCSCTTPYGTAFERFVARVTGVFGRLRGSDPGEQQPHVSDLGPRARRDIGLAPRQRNPREVAEDLMNRHLH